MTLALLLLVAAPARAQRLYYTTEARTGLVMSVSMGSSAATTSTTVGSVVSSVGTPDGEPLFDVYGRARFQWRGKRLVKLGTPAWADDEAMRTKQRAVLLDQMDALTGKIIALERWQATLSLVLIKDRASELTAAMGRLDALKSIYGDP